MPWETPPWKSSLKRCHLGCFEGWVRGSYLVKEWREHCRQRDTQVWGKVWGQERIWGFLGAVCTLHSLSVECVWQGVSGFGAAVWGATRSQVRGRAARDTWAPSSKHPRVNNRFSGREFEGCFIYLSKQTLSSRVFILYFIESMNKGGKYCIFKWR